MSFTFADQAFLAPKVAASFNPLTQVTALQAGWADDPSWTNPGDGNAVSSWRNHSGGGDPASTGTNRPTFRASTAAFNNRATVEFVAASSQRLDFDTANAVQPVKVIAVGNVGGNTQRLMGLGAATGNGVGSGTGTWTLTSVSGIGGGTSDTSPHVFRGTLNGASSQLWVDESSVATGSISGNWLRITLGAGSNNTPTFGNFLNGHVAFWAIYAGATSDASLSTLCDDLQTYYGTP